MYALYVDQELVKVDSSFVAVNKLAKEAAIAGKRVQVRQAAEEDVVTTGPRVLNIKDVTPNADNVYIGRGRNGPWGNPFHIENGTTREQAVQNHKDWLEGTAHTDVEPQQRQWVLDHIEDLRGKNLVCHCAPLACHGDTLLELANSAAQKEELLEDTLEWDIRRPF